MNYSYFIEETLKNYAGNLYKMIGIKIIKSEGKFEHRALPINLQVSDGVNSINSFINIISGNQRELITYFTVDAFTGFSNTSTIQFGYGGQYNEIITNVNVQNITSLPSFLSAIPHQVANNLWLQSL